MRAQFILHASRAFFACAWADAVEQSGGTLRGEIMSQMPSEIDPAAVHAAETLLNDMLRANGVDEAATLLLMVGASEGDRPADMENFAHYSAMQAMGHGVGLADAFGHDASERVRVPYVEFGDYSLEKDYRLETAVIFRTYKAGDVIALFPYVADDRRGALYACESYQHVGQHGGADYDAVVSSTRPAKPEEFAALKSELESLGYRLRVIARRNRSQAS